MISAFLSCRNHGKYVRAAIDSVMLQTVKPTEFFLINDGSRDNTMEVFEQAAKIYPEIHIVDHRIPQGHINCYNEGILRSKGDMLHLMSADDVLLDRTFYERGIKALETACLFSGALQWMDSDGNLLGPKSVPPFEGEIPAELTIRAMRQFGNFICGAATLVRADLQRKHYYDSEYPYTADAVNWARILAHGYPAAFTQDIVFLYRRHKEQMTNQTTGPEEERVRMKAEIERQWNFARLAEEARLKRGSSL